MPAILKCQKTQKSDFEKIGHKVFVNSACEWKYLCGYYCHFK